MVINAFEKYSGCCCGKIPVIRWHARLLCVMNVSNAVTLRRNRFLDRPSIMSPFSVLQSILLFGMLMPGLHLPFAETQLAVAEEPTVERTGRIVHAWDGCSMWSTIFNVDYYGPPNREIREPAAEFSQRMLQELVDEEAAADLHDLEDAEERK